MIRHKHSDGNRHSISMPYMTQEMMSILTEIEKQTGDPTLTQSIFFSPTAITQIKRILEVGGTIITDTTLVANGIDSSLLADSNVRVTCFIDDPQVMLLAEQRRITRAEIATDYALSVPGPKLIVIGTAPSAINRIIQRRQREPMSDICVMGAATGFASVVQLKEKLMDTNLTSIVVRGKKGGIPTTITIINAILHEITKGKI